MIITAGTLTREQIAAIDNEQDTLLDVRTASGALGLTKMTIRQWVYRYHLPHTHIDGRLAILASAIHACYQARRHAGGGKPREYAAQRRSRLVTSNRPE